MIINSNEKVSGEQLLANQGWSEARPGVLVEAPLHDKAVSIPEQKGTGLPYSKNMVTNFTQPAGALNDKILPVK